MRANNNNNNHMGYIQTTVQTTTIQLRGNPNARGNLSTRGNSSTDIRANLQQQAISQGAQHGASGPLNRNFTPLQSSREPVPNILYVPNAKGGPIVAVQANANSNPHSRNGDYKEMFRG